MEVTKHVIEVFKKFPKLKMATYPKQVKIVEVSPRDGLQNEKKFIDTKNKIIFINRLNDCGLKVIEATSFVSPKAIPQLKDNLEVFAAITKKDGVSYPVLVPNQYGMEQALKLGVKEIAVFSAASEAFTQKNINCTIEESFQRFEKVIQMAKQMDIKVRGYVSCVMGCPYEGEINPKIVNFVSKRLLEMGCYEISLGDTIGIGNPEKTYTMLNAIDINKNLLAVHFHNTYDRAIQNLVVALSEGIQVIDSSAGGIGGCPYANGASGNVATEDVLYLCELLGIDHGVDFEKLIQTGKFITNLLSKHRITNVIVEDLALISERKSLIFN